MSQDEPSYEVLRAENEALRRRIGVLEREIARRDQADEALTEHERGVPYREIFDAIPVSLAVYRRDGLTVAINRTCVDLVGGVREEIVGKFNINTDPAAISMGFLASFKKAMAERRNITMPATTYDTSQSDLGQVEDRVIWTEATYVPIEGDDGTAYVVECNIDVTAQQRALQTETENRRLQEEIIRVQEQSLRALSTPLIPIAERVVVMPLIGAVSGARVQQVIGTLLEGVSAHRAEVAILDVTGVPPVDAQAANALIQAAQAVALLGAEVVLTGIRPEMAHALVDLGTDLSGLVTRATLQSGIQYALEHKGERRSRTAEPKARP